MSDSLRPHELQHARRPCPSPSPGLCSNSCPLSWWYCLSYYILCCPLLLPSIFSSIKVFSNESALRIRWPRYWNFSFSISPSNEYSGLISFRFDWFGLLAVQGVSRVFSPASQFENITSLALSLLYGPNSHLYMTTGKIIALTRQTFVSKVVSLLFNTLIHVNVWQKPLQYCKVISLQLIKINGKINKYTV